MSELLTEERIHAPGLNGDVLPPSLQGVRLHLGAGRVHLAGWENIDRHTGQEVYPLAYPDESVEEIVASHILEHFGHRSIQEVLLDWVRVLKPGGKIMLAVPDFEKVAKSYLAGEEINVQGYVMGGHVDDNDRHGAIFDRETLEEVMAGCGLERIGEWKSDIPGCSQLPISLNMQGFKPCGRVAKLEGIKACMSVPRFGPLMHPRCVEKMSYRLKIQVIAASSCFWHQKLSDQMEECIADPKCEFVLTMDYDTVFDTQDVVELYRLMRTFPHADAVVPIQCKRNSKDTLFSLVAHDGSVKQHMPSSDLERNLLPLNTGHFGLTLFRADALRKFERPWMVPKPGPDGRWDVGHTDADIDFWIHFRKCGFKAYVAPRVVVGHLAEVIQWPGKDLQPVYQSTTEYDESGIPAEVQR